MARFTHLHLHTEYSLLDGANRIENLAKHLQSLGMDSVGVTDHGCMFGAIDFYISMLSRGIKPILGIETYIHNDEALDSRNPLRFHLCLFAKNNEGYKNLIFLSSQAYLHGFFRNPRINKKILREHKNGLICSSACLQGEVNWHLNLKRNAQWGAKGIAGARAVAQEYQEIFGEDFYLEIMRHGIPEQRDIDEQIIEISRQTGIKLIATNDTHYTTKKDSFLQEVLMCISTGKILADTNRLRHSVGEFYVKSIEEMEEAFRDIPEALDNTQEIVKKCNLTLDLKGTEVLDPNGNVVIPHKPPTAPSFRFTKEYAQNEGLDYSGDDEYFEYKCYEGFNERLAKIDSALHDTYRARLEYEIKVIKEMKFSGYMLIVWDFVNFAKSNGIPVGPGRGSAAGSLVAFCLKITDIDPIKYMLLFERFLNPERVSMPDVDMDFCQRRRGEIIDYVSTKYGKSNVSQVITFNNLSAKSVVRDVARVFGVDYNKADKFAKLIPNEQKIKLQTGELYDKEKMGAYEKEPRIRETINTDETLKKVWDMSLQLENQKRNAGVHAAAIVIDSEHALWEKIPLCNIKDKVVTQYSGNYLEMVDLIKFDFLGLKTLTVIDDALKLIATRYGKVVDFGEMDDAKVYEKIQSGNTLGLFQIESKGMQGLGKKLKPSNLEDIIAMIAMYRPGPMDNINNFVNHKHGVTKVSYAFPALEPILKATYGVIVYQEQIMQIVQEIGGFSLGKADLVRKAISKKKLDLMKSFQKEFVDGAAKQGYDRDKATHLWETIVEFAGYGFNKSHSAAYAVVCYQTAYLKTYYEHEFMAALLTSEKNNPDNLNQYIQECRNMGIEVVPPHINHSMEDFSIIEENGKKKIVFGFSAIKGIGDNPIQILLKARGDKPFADLHDVFSRLDSGVINRRIIESLAKSGALNGLGFSVRSIMENIDYLADTIRNNAASAKMLSAEGSLFADDETAVKVELPIENIAEYSKNELLDFEYEMLGIFMNGNPLDEFAKDIEGIKGVALSSEIQRLKDGSKALIIGIIKDIKYRTSKKGNRFAEILLVDKMGNITLQVFEKHLPDIESAPKNAPICLRCFASAREEIISLQLNKILSLDEARKERVKLEFSDDEEVENLADVADSKLAESKAISQMREYILDVACNISYESLKRIQGLAMEHSGEEQLVFRVKDDEKQYILHSTYKINDAFKAKIHDIKIA